MNEYLFWLLVAAYAAHVLEEYTLGWKKWVYAISGVDVDWSDFFLANFVVIIVGICFAVIGYRNLYISLMYPALMAINAVFFHILPTIVRRRFSPGVITSIGLFLPLAGLVFYDAYEASLLSRWILVSAFGGGMVMMIFPVALQQLKIRMK